MSRLLFLLGGSLLAASVVAHPYEVARKKPAPQGPSHAVCVLRGIQGSEVTGVVHFQQEAEGVRIEARIEGLAAGRHGFHIHEFGDCTAPDGSSAGRHFAPMGQGHGGPNAARRHEGDLGNLFATEAGVAAFGRVDEVLTLRGPASFAGRSVVVHARPDDLRSQPDGRSGPAVACGVIGVAGGPSRP